MTTATRKPRPAILIFPRIDRPRTARRDRVESKLPTLLPINATCPRTWTGAAVPNTAA